MNKLKKKLTLFNFSRKKTLLLERRKHTGQQSRCKERQHPELFWETRRAGGIDGLNSGARVSEFPHFPSGSCDAESEAQNLAKTQQWLMNRCPERRQPDNAHERCFCREN